MGHGPIFMVDVDGGLPRMSPSAPDNEDHMRQLVARYPEVISDSLDGAGRWSLDHLFVTIEAVPVLVELKCAVDTRLRREVVG